MNVKLVGGLVSVPRYITSPDGLLIGAFTMDVLKGNHKNVSVSFTGELAESLQETLDIGDAVIVQGKFEYLVQNDLILLMIKATNIRRQTHDCSCIFCTE
jgi:single-stranded DNA-binding protein